MTKLWYVGMTEIDGKRVVAVCDYNDIKFFSYQAMKIRSITPRAAARRYIRNNLADHLVGREYKDCDRRSMAPNPDPEERRKETRENKDITDDLIKMYFGAVKYFVPIVVLK